MTAIWMVSSGHDYEQESSCFEENRIFLPIPLIQNLDFTEVETYGEIRKLIEELLEEGEEVPARELSDQVAEFSLRMERGDLVLMPLRGGECVAIGRIVSPYGYDSAHRSPLKHLREMEWITRDASSHTFYKEIKISADQNKLIRRITEPNIEKEIFSEIGKLLQSQKVGREPLAEPPPVSFDIKFDSRLSEDATTSLEPRARLGLISTTEAEPPTEEIQKPNRSPDAGSFETNTPYQIGDESITFEALLAVESGIAALGLPRLVEGILKAKGFSLTAQQRNSDRSLSLLASKGDFGLGGTRILVQVVSSHKGGLGLQELGVCKRLTQSIPADRRVIAIWQDELPPDEVLELATQGWLVWNRVLILNYLLGSYSSLEKDIQSQLRLKTIWVQA